MSDWIEWKGGKCPVSKDTLVEVRTIPMDIMIDAAGAFDWSVVEAYRVVSVAGTVRWEPTDRPEDLVAYHVVAPAEEPRTLTGVWVRRDAGGGECPVPHDTLVEVRTISGDVGVDVAGAFDWSVVEAYRVVRPAEKPVSRGGVKHDQGKPLTGLMLQDFARALETVATVTTFGAQKYSPSGWLAVPEAERRYTDALCRHLLADLREEATDSESGLPHLAHAAWNALALLELRSRGRTD